MTSTALPTRDQLEAAYFSEVEARFANGLVISNIAGTKYLCRPSRRDATMVIIRPATTHYHL